MPSRLDLTSLNLLQRSRELTPILHNNDRPSISQHLLHLRPLIRRIRPNIAHSLDARSRRTQRTTLAILNRHALLGRLAQHLQRMQINSRVRLTRGFLQARGSRVDKVTKVLVLANLLDGCLDAAQSRRRHHGHLVLVGGSQLLELLVHAGAGLEGGLELGDDSVLLAGHVGLEVRGGDFDAVARLERRQHTAEVLADEFLDQRVASEADFDVAGLGDLVDQVGAGFKGKFLGEDERVVAIEQEGVDLRLSALLILGTLINSLGKSHLLQAFWR